MKSIQQTCNEIIEASEKAEPTPWIQGGCSGRMITTPSGYIGDGFLADVDTKANSNYIVLSANQAPKLAKALLVMQEALAKVRDHETLDGDKYNSHEQAWHGVAEFAGKKLAEAGKLLGGE